MFTARIIRSWQEIAPWMDQWRKLHHELTPDNPFTAPLWTRLLLTSAPGCRNRKTAILYSGKKGEEGLILFFIANVRRFGLPALAVESPGVGPSANRRHFAYIQEPLLKKAAAGALLKTLAAMRRWSYIRLAPLPADYPLSDDLVALAPRYGMIPLRRDYAVGYRIDARIPWQDYEKTRSRKFLQNMRRALKSMGSGAFTVQCRHSGSEADRLLELMQAVSGSSWKARTGGDLFHPSFNGFYRQAFLQTLAAGRARLYALFRNDTAIAYEWHVQQGRRIYALKADYRQEYARFSPGNLLAWHALQESFSRGADAVDYLMGQSGYKHRWATSSYRLEELLLFRNNGYSRLLSKIYRRQDALSPLWKWAFCRRARHEKDDHAAGADGRFHL